MFIASLICLIAGIALIAIAVVFFFRDNVMEAFQFIRNKRTGRGSSSARSNRIRRRPNLKSAGKVKVDKVKSGKLDKNIKKSSKKKDDSSTYVLTEEDSEDPTSLLSEDSEQPTGLLGQDSESPTGLLGQDSESSTSLLDDESESPTGLLDDSETPTGVLADDSEDPTTVLDESDVITKKKDVKKKKQSKTVDSDFKFEIVKEVIVVHTKEKIE